MTNYSRGKTFELSVVKDLLKHGWYARRNGGSRGVEDVIAIQPFGRPALIQCKLDGRLSIDDRRALRDLAAAFTAIPILAYKDNGIQYSEICGESYADWHPSIEKEAAA